MQCTQPRRKRLKRRLRFVEPDVTIPLAAAQSASLPKSVGTKKTLVERFPALRLVISDWNQHHERTRTKDDDVSFDDNLHTFNQILKRRWSDCEEGGVQEESLPRKVSTGWFCKLKAQVGVKDNAIASRELRRPEHDEDAKFMEELRSIEPF